MCKKSKFSPAAPAAGPLGLLAGNGVFPKMFAEAARAAGEQVVALAIKHEARPDLDGLVHELHWVDVGKLGTMIRLFKQAGVRRAAMAGGVRKQRFFSPHRLDLTTIKLAASLILKRDDEILRAVAHAFEREGITIVPSTIYLDKALVPSGVITRRQPTEQQLTDLRFGFRVAKEIGKLDIGQAVVLKDGIVLAVEAIEGTDRCIERGATLGKGEVVVVKVAKPDQDLRFDLPAVGTRTIEGMKRHGAVVLGLEAGRTLLLDPEAVVAAADRAKVVMLGLADEGDNGT